MRDPRLLGWMTRAQIAAAHVSLCIGALLMVASLVGGLVGAVYWLSGAFLLGVAALLHHRALSYHPEL